MVAVDNSIYDRLGERWYTAADDPVALLRAEARLRNPWVLERLGPAPRRVLDLGCGAGFLANALAGAGHEVVGVDAAADALAVARRHDPTGRAAYLRADAFALPFPDGTFDAVCAMDFLEHVEEAEAAIAEAARVLAPGGRFFFHTFDRTWLAWLIVIKGVEWFVQNTPKDMHVLRLFRRPREVAAWCRAHGLEVVELHGSRPRLDRAFFRMLRTRVVPPELSFTFTRSTRLGYTGLARKGQSAASARTRASRSTEAAGGG